MPYIRVAVDVPLPTLFDYWAPDAHPADVGYRVRVPFGRAKLVGIIMAVENDSDVAPTKVRPADEILRDVPPIPSDIRQMLGFCSGYYHHPIGEVVSVALPARFRSIQTVTLRVLQAVRVTSTGEAEFAAGKRRAPVLEQLYERIRVAGGLTPSQVGALAPAERRALKRLLEKHWVEMHDDDGRLTSADVWPEGKDAAHARPLLTGEQSRAVESIANAEPGFRTWLLHGVTGSGKTEVYLRLMEQRLLAGGQVLFLVPEIGLTPQLEGRIRARFARWHIVTLHSGLADGERARNWIDAAANRAHIVLGTRSAVFTPMPQLGLIVVDEEHDASYKQIDAMRYSARDLAVWRGRQRNIPVILGSATPSLESYHAALSGRYSLLTLVKRANDAPLPGVSTVPIRAKSERHGLSAELIDAIRHRIANQEQVLVFINRRGYAPVLVCSACAWAPSCHRCSARLVLHKNLGRMMCHHCGHAEAVPMACPACGNLDLHPLGYGTQRVEAALDAALPGARILRIDRDTTRLKDAWPAMRVAVERREVDVLVGTQLISKGHDFPGLGLVCVLNADQSLFSTDFRAAEHLFAQLTQVAGRAGRGHTAGEMLVQTQFPDHPLYQAVRAHDYVGFARALLAERQSARFPPFVHQAVLRAESAKLAQAIAFLGQAAHIAAEMSEGVDVFEPTPATMERLKGRERAQLLVQSDTRSALHAFLDRWTDRLIQLRAFGARWAIDVDPLGI